MHNNLVRMRFVLKADPFKRYATEVFCMNCSQQNETFMKRYDTLTKILNRLFTLGKYQQIGIA